jgi:Flp pilus assembly protein TadD
MDLNRQRYPEAIRYLRQATILNPTNPDAFLYLGQVYFEMNHFVDAESALRKAIALTDDPSRNRYQIQKAHFLLGRILMQKHQADAARGEMELAHALSDKALSHDRGELSGLLNTASDPGVDDSPGTNRRPQLSATLEIDAAAIKAADAFKEHLRPAVGDGYNNLGAISATQKRYDDAVRYFEAAASWNSKLPGLNLNWGRAAFMASQFSEAVPPLKRYSSLHPEDAGIRSALAISLFRIGQYQSCLDTLKHVTMDPATIPQVAYIYAESLIKTGQLSLGEQRLEALATARPDIAEVQRGLGEALALQGDKDKAIQHLQKAISLNANDADARYALGKIELGKGDTQAAISDLESAVQLSPREAAFHQTLSAAYKVALRPADAERENRLYESFRASQTEPVTPTTHQNSDQEPERSQKSSN